MRSDEDTNNPLPKFHMNIIKYNQNIFNKELQAKKNVEKFSFMIETYMIDQEPRAYNIGRFFFQNNKSIINPV